MQTQPLAGRLLTMESGAIILCGGESTRMGRDKAKLPFGPECLLQRVVRLVSEVVRVRHIVVVSAAGQSLPTLPSELVVAHDSHALRGPLEGLAAGLAALPPQVKAAYVTSCDAPLLVPGFARQMLKELGDFSIAVPRDDQYYYPLSAVYSRSVLAAVHAQLQANRLRLQDLFKVTPTREVSVDDLQTFDPQRLSLRNINTPEEYHEALRLAGIS